MDEIAGSNPILDAALKYEYPAFAQEGGVKRVVAFGDHSHKCPVYVERVPPCTAACPAGEDIRGYHNLLREAEKSGDRNKWEAAFRRITLRNPFPSIMGRVCPAPCESKCNRKEHDAAVGINSVEHAIGEYALKNALKFDPAPAATGKRVAIVGGGPAGLSCAYQLRRRGHAVTIYDAAPKLGGMVRYGIMGYRVSREVLEAEIQRILDLGIEVKTGVAIGRDVTLDELSRTYDAVFIGIGAQKGRNLPVPGADGTPDATNAVDFLAAFEHDGTAMRRGKNVVVIGDGDVAMDVARLAIRLGSRATLLTAVPRAEMACQPYEFEEAEHDGTAFNYGVSVVEILRNGGAIRGVRCVRMEKKAKGEEGYNAKIPFLRYKPVPGSEMEIPCDMVVASIGQATDTAGFEKATGGGAFIRVDGAQKVPGFENVYAGGDILKIDLITTAVGHGRKAAEAIDAAVRGEPAQPPPKADVIGFERIHSWYFPESAPARRTHARVERVEGDFAEGLQPLTPEQAAAESDRCMSCGQCFSCRQCLMYCPQEAIQMFRNNPAGQVMFTHYEKCVGCHICAEICPCGYIDMGMGDEL
jgi:NADPH-dependent glutamate synthase beta subunit-like oxidoreductase